MDPSMLFDMYRMKRLGPSAHHNLIASLQRVDGLRVVREWGQGSTFKLIQFLDKEGYVQVIVRPGIVYLGCTYQDLSPRIQRVVLGLYTSLSNVIDTVN